MYTIVYSIVYYNIQYTITYSIIYYNIQYTILYTLVDSIHTMIRSTVYILRSTVYTQYTYYETIISLWSASAFSAPNKISTSFKEKMSDVPGPCEVITFFDTTILSVE